MALRESALQRARVVVPLGWVCLATGVLGLASAIFLLMIDPAVSEDRYSYPFTAQGFAAIQVFFFVHHFGLLGGLYGLWRSGAVGASRMGRWGAWGAIVGMGLLTVTELVAITASNATYPSAETEMIDSLYGISSLLIGVALVMAGIAVLRARRWQGWYRFLPLILGLYVFIPMTPAMVSGYEAARYAIGGWMLGFAFLGWALIKTVRQ
ncbi:MAG: hypothetical protein M3O70_13695 [Actinomycetota bacterium]|nr:hypothetical protein [Actinomycetota bacterium]